MGRNMRLLMLVACLSLGVREAAADGNGWWGWLEEFSGPGPFRGPYPGTSLGENFCSKDGRRNFTGLKVGTQNGSFVSCIWTDQRFFRARPEPALAKAFPEINLGLYDAGVSLSYKYIFSVGAGAGLARFVSTDGASDFTKTRFTIAPVRVTVSPLEVIRLIPKYRPASYDSLHQTLGVVKLYGKVVCFPGSLSGADFAAGPTSTFTSGGECKLSYGLQIDFLDLIGLNK